MTSKQPFTFKLLSASGIEPTNEILEVLSSREELMSLSQEAHDACIIPKDSGGISLSERAALASRMCNLNSEHQLANYYAGMVPSGDPALQMADPLLKMTDSPRIDCMLKHTDLVTTHPKDTIASDIQHLEANGFSTADIVRLSELIAFVNYTIRVVKGVRLMEGIL
ncbi:MAG: hypothetical protein VX966_08975 [Chloroflexota bacterium]|nr:hypothetical protein [Chloroflexota bacterium]